MSRVIAVVPVRGGGLPPGGDEAVAEAAGRAVLVGEGTAAAAERLTLEAGPVDVRAWEAGTFQPARWARGLAAVVEAEDVVILPETADGRDLAPRLAHELARPLVTGAIEVTPDRIVAVRHDGRVMDTYRPERALVTTLLPGCRGVEPGPARTPAVEMLTLDAGPAVDADVDDVLDPDPSTMDLADARRVVGAGYGLGGPDGVAALATLAAVLGAAVGATRLVVDVGWLPFERQIGTTGAEIDPDLYLAFGISGAIQHLAGLGDPDHVVSVNLDPSCPMMALADLAVVSDAPAVVDEMLAQLRVSGRARGG
jgi:electron transfer flavoprotein alpha subunit